MKRIPPVILERARSMRKASTEAEIRLWARLKSGQLGQRFVRQMTVGPYICDFVCRAAKLVVEVDGSQHFGSEEDARRTTFLETQGYRVLRFTNHDALTNTDGAAEMIRAELCH